MSWWRFSRGNFSRGQTGSKSFSNATQNLVGAQFGLEIRKPDAAVWEIRETPIFAFSDPCDCVPLSAYRNFIRAEHAQFFATNDAFAVFLNLPSYICDLRFQRRAVVPHVLNERVQTLKIIYSNNKAIISSSDQT
jgi:hypothetical protein